MLNEKESNEKKVEYRMISFIMYKTIHCVLSNAYIHENDNAYVPGNDSGQQFLVGDEE